VTRGERKGCANLGGKKRVGSGGCGGSFGKEKMEEPVAKE